MTRCSVTGVSYQQLLQKELIVRKTVKMDGMILSMLLIRDRLWCLTDDKNSKKILVCDTRGRVRHTVTGGGWGMTLTDRGHVIVAGDCGLSQYDTEGNFMRSIEEGYYYNVSNDVTNNIYAICKEVNGKPIVQTFRYQGEQLEMIKEIKPDIETEGFLSLAVIKDCMFICDRYEHCIYRVQLSDGHTVQTYGRKGGNLPGELNWPRLCGKDSSGLLLVADCYNHCLQVLDPETDSWSVVQLTGIWLPCSAMLTDQGTLYVGGVGIGDYKLYLCN